MVYLPPQISPLHYPFMPVYANHTIKWTWDIYVYIYIILSNYSRTARPFFLPHPSAFSDPNGLRASLLVIRIPGWLVVRWTAGCKLVCKFTKRLNVQRLQEVERNLTRKSPQIEQKHTHTHVHLHTQISDLSGPCWGLFGMNRLWNTWTEFTKYEKLPCKRPNTFCGECNFQNNQLHKICPFMGLEMKCVLKFRQPYSEIIARSLIIHQFPKF